MLTELESEEGFGRILEFLGPGGTLVCECVSRTFRNRIRTPGVSQRLSRLIGAPKASGNWKDQFRCRNTIRSDRILSFTGTVYSDPPSGLPPGIKKLGWVATSGSEGRERIFAVGDYFIDIRQTSFSLIKADGAFIGTYPIEFQKVLNSPFDPGQTELLCVRLDRSIAFFSPSQIARHVDPGTSPKPLAVSSNVGNIIPRYAKCFWGDKLLIVTPLYASIYRINRRLKCSCLWNHRHDGAAAESMFQLRKQFIMETNKKSAIGYVLVKVYDANDGSLLWLRYVENLNSTLDLRMSNTGLVYAWFGSNIWWFEHNSIENEDVFFDGSTIFSSPMMTYPYCKTYLYSESVIVSTATTSSCEIIGVADFVCGKSFLYEIRRSRKPRIAVVYRSEPLTPAKLAFMNLYPKPPCTEL